MGKAQKSTQALGHIEKSTLLERHTDNEEEDIGPMALSTTAREWFRKNRIEGFLWIADAPPLS